MMAKINWVGLAAGSAIIAVVIFSIFIPWWHISADVTSQAVTIEGLINADISPLNTNFSFLGKNLGMPLLTALNIVGLLSMTASGIVMLIYSVLPTKPYSKHLLGFAYRKPLYLLVFFVIPILAISMLIQSLAGLSIPLSGSTTVTPPEWLIDGNTVSITISTGFFWPFWLAAVAAGLCLAARIYHKRLTATKEPSPQPPPTEPAPPPPAPTKAPVPPTPAPTPPAPAETPTPTTTASTASCLISHP